MAIEIGANVQHPDDGRVGTVVDIRTNPACLMRHLVIRWDDGELDELEEIMFGELD